jgi:hypothetical protein
MEVSHGKSRLVWYQVISLIWRIFNLSMKFNHELCSGLSGTQNFFRQKFCVPVSPEHNMSHSDVIQRFQTSPIRISLPSLNHIDLLNTSSLNHPKHALQSCKDTDHLYPCCSLIFPSVFVRNKSKSRISSRSPEGVASRDRVVMGYNRRGHHRPHRICQSRWM